MVRKQFDALLKELYEDVLKMGAVAEGMVKCAITALSDQDVKLAEKVIQDDDIVDQMEIEIQNKCVEMIVLQQPVAKDIRVLASTFKFISNFERIADLAVNLSKKTIELSSERYIKKLVDLPRIAQKALEVVNIAIRAYIDEDVLRDFDRINKLEQDIDDLNVQVYRECVALMMENTRNIKQCISFITMANMLERIGDHGTNIFESIYYIITGDYKDMKDIEIS